MVARGPENMRAIYLSLLWRFSVGRQTFSGGETGPSNEWSSKDSTIPTSVCLVSNKNRSLDDVCYFRPAYLLERHLVVVAFQSVIL